MVKGVKDIAVYPAPFGGKPNKNIYTFKQEMLDALKTNQIPEKDKVKVLKKYLRGAPGDSIGNNSTVKTIDEAFAILIQGFGNPRETWSSILNNFKKKCMNAKGWSTYGSYERCQLIFKTVEFLRQALSYAEEFPRLSNEILHPNTVYAVVKVLPKYLYNDIRKIPEFIDDLDSSSESAGKKCIVKMKEIMEQEQKVVMKEVTVTNL